MDANYLIDVLGTVIGFTCATLVTLIAWNWIRLHKKIDEIVHTVKVMAQDVHKTISDHETRITVVERHLNMRHRKED